MISKVKWSENYFLEADFNIIKYIDGNCLLTRVEIVNRILGRVLMTITFRWDDPLSIAKDTLSCKFAFITRLSV